MCGSKAEGGMGFRELEVFNFALLAKQGWRLLKNPNSLMARVLKAKDHRTMPFVKARIGQESPLWG